MGEYDIFVNCNWVATSWQQYSTHLHTSNTQNNTINSGRVLAVPHLCELYPGICLITEEKARKILNEQPQKRVASNGNKLPDRIREGEIQTCITKNQSKLGRSVGVGGFGEIYLSSSNTYKHVGPDAHHVVKIEPQKKWTTFCGNKLLPKSGKIGLTNGRILQWILTKWEGGGGAWTGFNWLRVGPVAASC
jgi:hypothetical protein